jgi:WhiB family redox-sensing transcriptional regulator
MTALEAFRELDGGGFDGDRSLFSAAWWPRARCRDVQTAVFYPGRGDNFGLEVARAVCARCVVRAECLEYALAAHETIGVWGGLSERERRALRRQRARRPVSYDSALSSSTWSSSGLSTSGAGGS